MGYQLMDLKSAAAHLHMQKNELRHFAQRDEVPSVKRGEQFFFEHRALDEWAQRRLMSISQKALTTEHRAAMTERRQADGHDFHIAEILSAGTIAPLLTSKTRAGVLRDMTDFADSTGLLYDPETLFAELSAREEVASTAAGGGVAFLHPRYHDPYLFQETFLALGRTARPVFFGAQDGTATDLFFLICCTDHTLHLHILARLCLLAHGTPLLENLRAAEDAAAMHAALKAAEDEFLTRA
ncbi:MAG: PTS sugar transporter subunit IIA [Kiritimatiellae bacterium]|nr:PTS sugar transporter subunit IIA [Kiritimatiellia bacterium]